MLVRLLSASRSMPMAVVNITLLFFCSGRISALSISGGGRPSPPPPLALAAGNGRILKTAPSYRPMFEIAAALLHTPNISNSQIFHVPFSNPTTLPPPKVLLCMAEQVGKLTAHIGGKQHAHELLVPLEQLASVEESTVSQSPGVSAPVSTRFVLWFPHRPIWQQLYMYLLRALVF